MLNKWNAYTVFVLVLAAALLVGAAGPGAAQEPTATPNAFQQTLQARRDEMTATAEPTSAALPVIGPANAGMVEELAMLSRGRIGDMALSPDGETLAISTTVGIWLYDAQSLELERYIESDVSLVSIAWSPDGTTLAAGRDGAVWLWDAGSGELLTELEGSAYENEMLAWSPDGTILASGGEDYNKVLLWLIESGPNGSVDGKLVATLEAETEYLLSIAWSPDGEFMTFSKEWEETYLWQRGTDFPRDADNDEPLIAYEGFISMAWSPVGTTLAIGDWEDGTIQLWDAASGELLTVLEGHTSGIQSLAWSSDGTILASGSWDDTVRLWSVEGKELAVLEGHDRDIHSLAWSPDDAVLASGDTSGIVRLWSAEGEALAVLEGHTEGADWLIWRLDGKTLISGSWIDDTVRLWSAEGEALGTLEKHTDSVSALMWSPDGETLASGYSDGMVRLWPLAPGPAGYTEDKTPIVLDGHDRVHVEAVAWSPDGTILASAGRDDRVRLWSIEGKTLSVLEGHTDDVEALAWSPDGAILASGSDDDTARLWSADGEALVVLEGHTGWVYSLAWSPDGMILASGSNDDTLRLWSAEGAPLAVLEGHAGDTLAWSPDGKTLASGSTDNMVRLWSAEGEALVVLESHSDDNDIILSLAWSPAPPEGGTGSAILASGGSDDMVRLWSAEGEMLAVLEGHTGWVYSLAWSPAPPEGGTGSTILASGSSDDTVRLWSAEGEALAVLEGHTQYIRSVAWSPDGTLLASASGDSTIRLWGVPPDAAGEESSTLPTATAEPTPLPTDTPAPTNTPQPTPTPTYTPQPTATPVPPTEVVVDAADAAQDGMAFLVEAGFLDAIGGEQSDGYASKRITLEAERENWLQREYLEGEYANFAAGVEIEWETDATEDGCGFAFRVEGHDDYYIVAINRQGAVRWQEQTNDEWMGKLWQHIGNINTGAHDSNELILLARGGLFTLFVNGRIAGSYFDRTHAVGRVAHLIRTGQGSGETSCVFQDAWVWDLNSSTNFGNVLEPGAAAIVNTTESDKLNLRTGSGLGYDVQLKLEDGTPVTVLASPLEADGYTWWLVRTPNGFDGWVVEATRTLQTLIPAGLLE